MTHVQSALTTLIGEVLADPDLAHSDVFRRMLQAGLQDLINAEATVKIGAAPHERTAERTTRRNGTRPKTLATPAGEVDLQIPKLREGSFFPSLLHPRRRVDKALYAVICQAWIDGVSTRKVDQLIRALGNDTGISRSTVSRICSEIDEAVQEFLHRRIDHTWFPCLFLDATYLDVRHRGRVVSQPLVVATGVSGDGRREILGMALGDAETTDFWTEFLRGLRDRGLKVATDTDPLGVTLVTSDAHAGLKAAVKAILPGSGWQRCRVHFARNVTQKIGSARSKPVNALISTIFAQTTINRPRRYLTRAQLEHLAELSGHQRPLVLTLGYCGVRWGEAVALTVGDVDIARRRITVNKAAVEVRGSIHLQSPKTRAGIRRVPVPTIVMSALAPLLKDRCPSELVFQGASGGHMPRVRSSTGSRSWWKNALQAAGLPPMVVHDLRHTAASIAISAGGNVKVIQRMLGHASAAMTLDIYADLFEDDLDDLLGRLDDGSHR